MTRDELEKKYAETPYGFDKCPYCGADFAHVTIEDDDETPPYNQNYSVLLYCENCEKYFNLAYKMTPYYAEVFDDNDDSFFIFH